MNGRPSKFDVGSCVMNSKMGAEFFLIMQVEVAQVMMYLLLRLHLQLKRWTSLVLMAKRKTTDHAA